ncbi:pirin family protein [Alkalicoccus luteus]|uniref:Pirin family protein n=1 Tax=Alkalicoccus luteus TaxID=1237094 RepID=A0A969PP53_9BACI|nr:pirin-like C-terminal cupin domain-containing protein [Alkalicoccus luteus]NJP37820.1 pirin family protein [Alkalicoccus luteus]
MNLRSVKDFWHVQYRNPGLPHMQQGFVLPPEKMKEVDPFLLMAEDWFKRGVFSDHPHRGFQTITYVIDGRLEHSDNAGGYSILDAGDVQYMNAGGAARHAEEAYNDDLIHTLQLWLNLPKKDKFSDTFYQNIRLEDAPVVDIPGGHLRIYSGEFNGVKGPAESIYPFRMAELYLEKGAEFTIPFPGNEFVFSYVLAGTVQAGEGGSEMERSGTAIYETPGDGESGIHVKAASRMRMLFYSGAPIQEPVAAGGPFVMNTEAELEQAMIDYRNGKFGPSSQ